MTAPVVEATLGLTAAGARAVADAAVHAAEDRGAAVCVAVVDRSGHLVAFHRMDRAPLVSIDVAVAKARSAALLGGPSRAFEELVDGGSTALLATLGIVPLRGGMPVSAGRVLVGAVGVSGSTGEEDDAIAATSAETLRVP